jgi:hypothetical protein
MSTEPELDPMLLADPPVWCPLSGPRPEGASKPVCPVFHPELSRVVTGALGSSDLESLNRKLEHNRRRARKGLIFSAIALVLGLSMLIAGMLFVFAFKDVPASQDQITCGQKLQSEFMAEVGDAFNSPPSPNATRDQIAAQIKATSKKLHELGSSDKCE